MSAADLAIYVLLGLAAATVALASVGLLRAGDAFDRLHYAGLAGTTTPVLVAAAGVIQEWPSPGMVKVVLVALVLLAGNPVMTHALARAARVREDGRLRVRAGEGPDR